MSCKRSPVLHQEPEQLRIQDSVWLFTDGLHSCRPAWGSGESQECAELGAPRQPPLSRIKTPRVPKEGPSSALFTHLLPDPPQGCPPTDRQPCSSSSETHRLTRSVWFVRFRQKLKSKSDECFTGRNKEIIHLD